MDFRVVGDEILRTVICTIASATVIEAGDLCELSSGVPIKATATGAKVAYSPFACPNGDTQIELTVGNLFELVGTGDAAFAVTDKGSLADIVVPGGAQQIDVSASSTDVLVVDISENAGVVGSASNIRVRINKPIY